MSTTQKFCPHCGSPVVEGARFCASCGANVAPLPVETPAPAPRPIETAAPPPEAPAVPPPDPFTPSAASRPPVPQKSDRSGLVLVVIGIVLLLAVLAFFFFRPRNGGTYQASNEAEQAFPQPTDRTGRPKPPEPIIEVPPSQPVDQIDIIEEQPTVTDLTTTSIYSPSPVPTAPPPDPHAGEISEGDAINRVASYIRSNDYYEIPSSCFRVRSLGYENVGYTVEVIGTCSDIGNEGKTLGRWRVDAKTADVFVQRSDGRYLRPN